MLVSGRDMEAEDLSVRAERAITNDSPLRDELRLFEQQFSDARRALRLEWLRWLNCKQHSILIASDRRGEKTNQSCSLTSNVLNASRITSDRNRKCSESCAGRCPTSSIFFFRQTAPRSPL
jgi:hypothetical protein